MTKLVAFLAAAVTCTGLIVAGIYISYFSPRECSGTSISGGTVVAGGAAAIGGPFTLVNHKGETVTEKDVITGPTLIYFGFTYCPDVCPLDTARNAETIDLLAAKGVDVTPVFVSIDPERDTPAVLADFVEVLHPKMIGLTGTPDQVKAASQAYKTYFLKNGEGEDYLMDHTTFSYLMGTDGLIELFRRDVAAAQMAETIACLVEQN